MVFQASFTVSTTGRGTTDITDQVQQLMSESDCEAGLLHVFVHHTSASLMLCENADPAVRTDLERFMSRLAPDGDPLFEHTAEGPDDMPAHVRSVLTQSGLSIPVRAGRADLGVWQGIYLWEHRHQGHDRRITLSVVD
jgi:secondary thiamine-phosphate synthase enzyme